MQWNKLCVICAYGAPVMLGLKSGFQTKVKAKSPQAKGFHCIIHHYALACKTLPISLKKVLNLVIKLINFVKGSTSNSHLFKELCRDMNTNLESLLFYCAVQWLSKVNVVCWVFKLWKELKEFLQLQRKDIFVAALNKENWCKQLAYLADIFWAFKQGEFKTSRN